jgi:hypothetical protein
MSEVSQIVSIFVLNLIPEVISHLLEIPDVIAYYKPIITDFLDILEKVDFHISIMGVHIQENERA